MLLVKNINLTLGTQDIFDNLSFSLSYSDKIGVLGRNGAGKSTLLRVLAKIQPIDSGHISYARNKTIAYLPQEEIIDSQKTVLEQAMGDYDSLIAKQIQLNEIETKLSAGMPSDQAEKLLEEYQQLQIDLLSFDQEELRNSALQILKGLGFSEKSTSQKVSQLSVGWQMRVCLARLLLQKADFYLFDEPTNHLDLLAKEWLLSYLNEGSFGYLLVTHDQYYLNHACQKILEIENGKAELFNGNFSFYVKEKEAQNKILHSAYVQQQKEIIRKKKTIERFRASASKAKMAQSMQKNLDKMEIIKPPEQLSTISFNFPPVARSGKIVLELHNISKQFGKNLLFKNINGEVKRSQKVALIAANGVGKTTLFNIIVGNIPANSGTVTFGHNVSYAYFEQEQSRILKPNNTILQEIVEHCPQVTEEKVRTFLGSFLFSNDDVFKKIKSLSGGEKNRVAMVKVLLQNANFLILDEPTNHLDIYAKDVLATALTQYQGTILLVSHDHDFIQKYANTIMELTPTGLITTEGDYEGYLYYRKSINKPNPENVKFSENKPVSIKKSKPNRSQKKTRILERRIERLEKEIEKIGLTISSHDFHSPEYQSKLKKLQAKQQELEKTMKAWEEGID